MSVNSLTQNDFSVITAINFQDILQLKQQPEDTLKHFNFFCPEKKKCKKKPHQKPDGNIISALAKMQRMSVQVKLKSVFS